MNAKAKVLASAALGLAAILAAILAACDRPRPFRAPQAQAAADAPDPGYRAAPQVSAATRADDGAVTLSGRALPSAQLRMMTPAGVRIEARADGSGAWTAPIGKVSEPALFSLTEEAGGQTVSAEGLVAVLPGAPTVAPTVALLRAGFGAQVLPGAGKDALKILAVDYDVAGATVVSGRARAASPVRVLVDGQAPVEGAAGPDGRFSVILTKPLAPGRHALQVLTPQARADTEVTLTRPSPPKAGPYQAQAESWGWRVDWTTPGGGAQTTLLLAG